MSTLPGTFARPPLRRERTVVLGGVCAALAEHLGWSIRRTRLLALVTTALGGGGVLLYLWLWALVPLVPADGEDPAVRR
ncbi:PspC domain-containing protein, partial [Rathayibacter tanaceti]